MARLVGRSLSIGLCAESAYGDGVTTSAALYWTTPSTISGPIVRPETTEVPSLSVDQSGLVGVDYISRKYVDWEFSQPMSLDNDGMVLRAAVGTASTTGTGPYTHVFRFDIDQPATLGGVIEMAEEDGTFHELEMSGLQARFIRWEIAAGGYVVQTVSFFGNIETIWTDTPTQTPAAYKPSKATIPFAKQVTTMTIHGTAYNVTSATVEFNRNTNPDLQHLGEEGISQSYPSQNTSATMEVVLPLPDYALLAVALAETQGTVVLTITNGSRSASWELENASVVEHAETVNGVGLVEGRVRLKAHAGGTYGARVTVVNAQANAVVTQGTAA